MKKNKVLMVILIAFSCFNSYGQGDDTRSVEIEEVVITGKQKIDYNRKAKPLASVEEYLQSAENVNMIKRGAYGWEPVINNMATERLSITIDGMKIFSACTDKMDPVTSYVETMNLSKVNINSGFGNDPQATNNIGGSIDLKLNKTGFDNKQWGSTFNSGYESNGHYQVYGAGVAYSGTSLYANSGVSYRHSGNYIAGGDEEVDFSQFTKTNLFTNLGFRPATNHIVEGTVIYDAATDIGYPALPMDVKSANGLITSLSYRREKLSAIFSKWETKFYYNNLAHAMDDTHRPNVVMHMDMPGESSTGGFYSLIEGQTKRHYFAFNWDGYYNRSYAEMTMYPSNPAEKPMFMLSWPDVRTLNSGIFVLDEFRINGWSSFRWSSRLSVQRDGVQSSYGLNTLDIYYPGMHSQRNRFLWNTAGRYRIESKGWESSLGVGYGTRAPSVSEGYGYFMFNSFDGYDYLGNPGLKNESSVKANFSLGWKNKTIQISAETACFYFSNYMIGQISYLYPMTMGASGVKKFGNLPHALISNSNLLVKYRFLNYCLWSTRFTYSLGRDDVHANLPFISPPTAESTLAFMGENLTAEISVEGATRQDHYSPQYGETPTAAYLIGNLSVGYVFHIGPSILNLKAGIENVWDVHYSTYSDWNDIPRKGRNFFLNMGFNI